MKFPPRLTLPKFVSELNKRSKQVRIVRDPDNFDDSIRGGVLTVGNFDGVHRGHGRILATAREMSTRLQGPAIVFTFEPHPLRFLRPDAEPARLSWLEQKAELLATHGIDFLVAYPTTPELLQLEYTVFFEEILLRQFGIRGMVEGPNFSFGRNREGTPERLRELTRSANVELEIVPLLGTDDEVVSSSLIRRLISDGKIEEANDRLGHDYQLIGTVVKGDQRGRELGFPTANLDDCPVLVPGYGVYAGSVVLGDDHWAAAVHIGPNPTFGDPQRKIEIHLIDFQGDLYGKRLNVSLHRQVRGVRTFDSAQQLMQQLSQDVEAIRIVHASHRNA